MTSLPGGLGSGSVAAWRIDRHPVRRDWNSGEGAYRVGGRWNSRGVRAVYCAIDPATAILEIAVHRGFRVLDMEPHVMTRIEIDDFAGIHVVAPDSVPNANWLVPGVASAGQQAFGDALLARHAFVVLPSAVSRQSWNLVFLGLGPGGRDDADGYTLVAQTAFALDPRLRPVATP